MDPDIRPATLLEIPAIVADMDQQFVFGKGRSISLAQRYPGVYESRNVGNIFVAEAEGGIVAALTCKLFDFQQHGEIRQGAMVGGVYTLAACRGQGIASALLVETVELLRQRGLDFAVLWTDQPTFYARSGWMVSDQGMLGQTNALGLPIHPAACVVRQAADAADVQFLQQLRQRWLSEDVVRRDATTYRSLPLPALSVTLLTCGSTVDGAAYALLGRNGATSILYEMVGNPAAYGDLWAQISREPQLYINEVHGSPAQQWLSTHANIQWQDKPLAMWMPLSENMPANASDYGYVPYFDRI